MKILHHQRLPHDGQVSIERLFSEIRRYLPQGLQVQATMSPFPSKALLPRLRNLQHARLQEADVHHIVGDVHYLAFGLPAKRLVLTIHDCAALNRLTGWKREVLKYLWFSGPMRRAEVVTTISETTKQELKNLVGALADDVWVIPNCVRSEFQASPKPFNAEQPLVLQVGTGWNKNVERVAEALRGTPCRLEIVGKLSDTQRNALAGSGVPFLELGWVCDEALVEAYRRCDFLIFASLYEGFGLPILEAQVTGRPVITSNRSSMPEAAGDGALFVNPDSVDEIRAAVLRMIGDEALRESLVRKGFDNVEKYRPAAIAARYAELYISLVRSTDAALPRP